MTAPRSLEWSDGPAGPVLAALEDADWRDGALCAQVDGELFFPAKGGSVREAKAVCRKCPSCAPCLQFALDNDERFGIWGATSERERRRLKRNQSRTKTSLATSA